MTQRLKRVIRKEVVGDYEELNGGKRGGIVPLDGALFLNGVLDVEAIEAEVRRDGAICDGRLNSTGDTIANSEQVDAGRTDGCSAVETSDDGMQGMNVVPDGITQEADDADPGPIDSIDNDREDEEEGSVFATEEDLAQAIGSPPAPVLLPCHDEICGLKDDHLRGRDTGKTAASGIGLSRDGGAVPSAMPGATGTAVHAALATEKMEHAILTAVQVPTSDLQ